MENIFFIFLTIILVIQVFVLFKIQNLLKTMTHEKDIQKTGNNLKIRLRRHKNKKEIPHICNFCKHRLVYINSYQPGEEIENFFYKCALKDAEIQLYDSCKKFQMDDIYLE